MPIKILTLNIWHDAGPWPARVSLIRHWLERLDPDLIALQEVVRGEGFDQLAQVVQGRSYHLDFVKAIPFWKEPALAFGNAVASRWPVRSRHELRLPDCTDYQLRAALTVGIEAPCGTLFFTSTHLDWEHDRGDVREQQVMALYDHVAGLQGRSGFPPIIAGDMNAEPGSDEIRFLTGLHSLGGRRVYMVDAWRAAGDGGPGYTWSNRNAYARANLELDRRIDYIFAGTPRDDGLGHVERCQVVCDQEQAGVWPSDHFGIYAELRLDPRPPGTRPAWRASQP
ncbi:MAG: endonuclease/exonuclease/phosphatase family protein [Proteobacteria bacterium]|nr:endonuclease/exonuclease/phosphatase family protein [Pseudomonadota bacterium]